MSGQPWQIHTCTKKRQAYFCTQVAPFLCKTQLMTTLNLKNLNVTVTSFIWGTCFYIYGTEVLLTIQALRQGYIFAPCVSLFFEPSMQLFHNIAASVLLTTFLHPVSAFFEPSMQLFHNIAAPLSFNWGTCLYIWHCSTAVQTEAV